VQLVDLNLLLYGANADSPNHARAREWLARIMGGTEAVALPWVVILGFVDGWLARPNVVVLHPGPGHWAVVRSLLRASGSAGNLTTDAHLAALAIEHGCELCTTDTDFGRFVGLRWRNPLLDTP
jgi:predicted nucleic acid-binding protein